MTIDWSRHHVWSADQIRAAQAEQYADKNWGSPIELEVRRRVLIAVATYGYEIKDSPIMSDAAWDMLAQRINPQLGTCHPLVDEFFAHRFSPMTGMWIHDHPELEKIGRVFAKYYTGVIRDYCERGVAHDRRMRQ